MDIRNKYEIEFRYVTNKFARSGQKLNGGVQFLVAHETANNTADADDHFRYFDGIDFYASAHIFVDATKILVIIPLDEKAWHVNYGKPTDNQMYGDDANDVAIGVELCRTGVFEEAYDRYVWTFAWLCDKYELTPDEFIVAHSVLDPERRSDPQSWLVPNGVLWADFIEDVCEMYAEFKGGNSGTSTHIPKKPVVKAQEITWKGYLRKGDSGARVTEMQRDLLTLGYDMDGYGADGHFGEATEDALMAFQRVRGLKVDGYYGPASQAEMVRALVEARRKQAKPSERYNLDAIVPYPGVLQRGSVGKEVKRLQRALDIVVDGHFGPATERAVKAYQKERGLTVDGFVGPVTHGVLY